MGTIVPRSLIARRFLLWALILGVGYAVINPPFAVNDERAHWLRARELSTGHLISPVDETGSYHRVPRSHHDLIVRYAHIQRSAESRVDVERLYHDLTKRSRDRGIWAREAANASSYTPIPYLPHLPMVWLARMLHLPLLWQVYLARLASLVCFAVLSAWAVEVAGKLGWAFFALGLMPMTLTQAAGLSADGMTNAFSFLFFALVAKGMLEDGSLSKRELGLLLGLSVLLTLCKVPYLLLSISLLGLRWEAPRAGLQRWGYAASACTASIAAHLIWAYLNRGPESAGRSDEIAQRAWVAGHLLDTVHVFALTFLTRADDYVIEFVVVRDVIHRQMSFVGAVIATLYLQVLFVAAWGAAWRPRPRVLLAGELIRFDRAGLRRGVLWLALSFALICGAIFLGMYLVASPIGDAVISGVQGRYFIPAVPTLLILLSAYGRPTLGRWLIGPLGTRLQVMVVVLNVLCLCSLFARYYGSNEIDWPY